MLFIFFLPSDYWFKLDIYTCCCSEPFKGSISGRRMAQLTLVIKAIGAH